MIWPADSDPRVGGPTSLIHQVSSTTRS